MANVFKSTGPISLSEVAEFLGISGQISLSDLYNVPGKRIADASVFAPNVPTNINLPISLSQFYGATKPYLLNITGDHINVDYLNISTLLAAESLPEGISRDPIPPWDPLVTTNAIVNIAADANLSGRNETTSFGATMRTGTGAFANLTIHNHGNIWGRGGNGVNGNGTKVNIDGKHAIFIETDCHIVNHPTGQIYGGGGGGAIGHITLLSGFPNITLLREGGHAGAGGAVGGAGESGGTGLPGPNGKNSSNSISSSPTTNLVNPLNGNTVSNVNSTYTNNYVAGSSGGFGQDAPNRVNTNAGSNFTPIGTNTGGIAGHCVKKSSVGLVVTLSNQGNVLGPNDANII